MARKETVTKVIDGDTFETSSRKDPVKLANENSLRKDDLALPKQEKLFAR